MNVENAIERELIRSHRESEPIDLMIMHSSLPGGASGQIILEESLHHNVPDIEGHEDVKSWVKDMPMIVLSGDPYFENRYTVSGDNGQKLLADNVFISVLGGDLLEKRSWEIKTKMQDFTGFIDKALGVPKEIIPAVPPKG